MLCNIYQTTAGENFMKTVKNTELVVKFGLLSLDTINPKTIQLAAKLLYNHILSFRTELKSVNHLLQDLILELQPHLLDDSYKKSTIQILLLVELHAFYGNSDL